MQERAYLGVYSTRARNTKGLVQKKMHFVWADALGGYLVQALDNAYQPVGEAKSVSASLFKSLYTHEPSILAMPVSRGKTALRAKARAGSAAPESAAGSAPEPESPKRIPGQPLFGQPGQPMSGLFAGQPGQPLSGQPGQPAKQQDEKGEGTPQAARADSAAQIQQTEDFLRNFFAKALQRLKQPGERKAALDSLKTLAEVEEGIVSTHKHMFADFGVALRKNSQLDLALSCCKRVLDLAPDDDHAHFNTARVLFEMQNFDAAAEHVLAAQHLDPSESVYQIMLDYIEKERRRHFRPQKVASRTTKKTTRRE